MNFFTRVPAVIKLAFLTKDCVFPFFLSSIEPLIFCNFIDLRFVMAVKVEIRVWMLIE